MTEAGQFTSVIQVNTLKPLTDSFVKIKTLITIIYIFNLSFNFKKCYERGSLGQMHNQ